MPVKTSTGTDKTEPIGENPTQKTNILAETITIDQTDPQWDQMT
jgi:hypothetical protein